MSDLAEALSSAIPDVMGNAHVHLDLIISHPLVQSLLHGLFIFLPGLHLCMGQGIH